MYLKKTELEQALRENISLMGKPHEINGIQLFHLNHYGNSMKELLRIMEQ